MSLYQYHIMAFGLGFVLDLILGDPYWLPHPIRLIGKWISWLEKKLLEPHNMEAALPAEAKRRRGKYLVLLVCLPSILVPLMILVATYAVHPIFGTVVESVMTYQLLATKCLRVESMKVYDRLCHGSLTEARHAVSMIVGRDTMNLTKTQVAKAAVETVAENTSDGIIAPMLFLAIGGPVCGFFYKAVNTMDSMVGYKNEKYMDFGRCAALLDDKLNYLPARFSAVLMVMSCYLLGPAYDGKKAWEIYKRDRYQHASPNSAQTESACAGALHLQLAGPASYFGKLVEKPTIGDAIREIEPEDIRRANRLMYATAIGCQCLCLLLMTLLSISMI